ncbi:hypothetical protein [Prevotella disiens]|uniref:hypothetical protein n=1 Tax=Prevotella disiens TaxID=28130 RepID=UPI000469DA8B|nr:hypothetical protein [Prevotella disiens]
MDNEHNPISIRIRQVQELWLKVRSEKPHARAFVMNYTPEDYALIEGLSVLNLLHMEFQMTHFSFFALFLTTKEIFTNP